MRRILFLVIVGLGGAAILVWLGVWQVQRLAWKQGVIANIETRIGAPPVVLPANPDPQTDAYLPVTATGTLDPAALRVLVSQKDIGAGYRIISALRGTDQGDILVDRGFLPVDTTNFAQPAGPVTLTGNLQWPQETDRFVPEPDIAANIWFARDVAAMAAHLDTRAILLVARTVSFPDGDVSPLPVDTNSIPNDHLNYAITWFSLAFIWLAMSLYFLRRTSRPSES